MIEYVLNGKELERAREVFNEYIKYDGMFGLFANKLVTKYQTEDNSEKPYTIKRITKLLNYYVESKNITEEELAAYQKVLAAEEDRKYIRGGIIAKAYIKFEGDWNQVIEVLKNNPNLADYQNSEKQVIVNYRKLLMAFIDRADNDIKIDFLIAKELRERYSLRDLKLEGFKKVYNAVLNKDYQTFESTIITSGIQKSGVKALRLAIPNIFDLKQEDLESLDQYIAKAQYAIPLDATKVVSSKKAYEAPKLTTMQERINFLRELLTYYLNSDLEYISEKLLTRFNLTKATFKSTLVIARTEGDLALKELINKYNAKEDSLKVQHDEMALELSNYIRYGIEVNGNMEVFTMFDYFEKFPNIDTDLMRKWALQVLTRSETQRIYDFFNRYHLSGQTYQDIESLIKSTDVSVGNKRLDTETKEKVVKIMQLKGYPLNTTIYSNFLKRVLQGGYDLDATLDSLQNNNQIKK